MFRKTNFSTDWRQNFTQKPVLAQTLDSGTSFGTNPSKKLTQKRVLEHILDKKVLRTDF